MKLGTVHSDGLSDINELQEWFQKDCKLHKLNMNSIITATILSNYIELYLILFNPLTVAYILCDHFTDV